MIDEEKVFPRSNWCNAVTKCSMLTVQLNCQGQYVTVRLFSVKESMIFKFDGPLSHET